VNEPNTRRHFWSNGTARSRITVQEKNGVIQATQVQEGEFNALQKLICATWAANILHDLSRPGVAILYACTHAGRTVRAVQVGAGAIAFELHQEGNHGS
jgi:hypothetical protein